MIVQVVDEFRICAIEAENDAPVGGDGDRILSCEIPSQPMEPPARRVHVLWLLRIVQRGQQDPKLRGMLRLNPSFGTLAKEDLKTLVPEALDHTATV